MAAALQALARADAFWEEQTWQATWTVGPYRQLAREVWEVAMEVRSGGGRGRQVRPERHLALLGEAAPAVAKHGAQDTLKRLEVFASLRGANGAATAVGRRCVACPDPLGAVGAAALGSSARS